MVSIIGSTPIMGAFFVQKEKDDAHGTARAVHSTAPCFFRGGRHGGTLPPCPGKSRSPRDRDAVPGAGLCRALVCAGSLFT